MYEELINTLRKMRDVSTGLSALLPKSGGDVVANLYGEAADAIEELKKEVLEWQKCRDLERSLRVALEMKKPRWISVEEKLPEKYHQVLVYGLNGMQIDYYSGEKSIGGRPLFMISEAKVTHWMPLPTPPKEETE